MLSLSVMADDNEIYIDQSGATANIDLEQLGDELDYDGMGDWGRFPPIKKKTPK